MASSSSQQYQSQQQQQQQQNQPAAPASAYNQQQYQQQIRYSTPPISQPVASSPLSTQSPLVSSMTPQQQQPSSVQSIQSPIMVNSYQQQHSSGGAVAHSPMPPSNQHYGQIQSPMPVSLLLIFEF